MRSDNTYLPQQSPINIVPSSTFLVQVPRDYLEIKYPDASLPGHFDGHHDFYFDVPPEVCFEGVTATLERIHLHSPSEHLVSGQESDFEIHFVHPLSSSIPETGSQRVMVLGVFFKEDKSVETPPAIRSWNKALKDAKLPEKGTQDREGVSVPASVNPWEFLPTDAGKYFRYEGSLTTPHKDASPNSEVVSWVVFPEVILVHPDDVAELKQYALDTARKPQPLYRRFVLRTFA